MSGKRNASEVVFLGAGASKPLGHPLTGEILPLILRRLKLASLDVVDEEDVSAETHREIAREFDFGFSWRHAWNGPNTVFDRPQKGSMPISLV